MKHSIQMINTTNQKLGTHQKSPRKNYMFTLGLLVLCSILSTAINAASPTATPTGITFTSDSGTYTQPFQMAQSVPSGQAGLFPGTNLKFYPGFVLNSYENEPPSNIESRWQQIFKGYRKESYRPLGIYGGITRRLDWDRYYANEYVRPKDPTDHKDPAYDWTKLDAVFNLNCVQNEGALVVLAVGEVGYSGVSDAPAWLSNPPYDGIFNSGIDGGSGKSRMTPKYYRNDIVQESLYFYQAMRDHLVATGNIDKVMFLKMSEFYVKRNSELPPDYDSNSFGHGVGTRARSIAKIWAESQISVQMSSLTGSRKKILWQYMDAPRMGITFPDVKMSSTKGDFKTRFSNFEGVYQKDIRQLSHNTEKNGQRMSTYFAPGIPNPWGYSGVTKPQTASHILWALSGRPKSENRDSGLGQAGDDPTGIMPVHNIFIDFERSWHINSPSAEEWHKAIETFGPPGTFAFPYLPPGYNP